MLTALADSCVQDFGKDLASCRRRHGIIAAKCHITSESVYNSHSLGRRDGLLHCHPAMKLSNISGRRRHLRNVSSGTVESLSNLNLRHWIGLQEEIRMVMKDINYCREAKCPSYEGGRRIHQTPRTIYPHRDDMPPLPSLHHSFRLSTSRPIRHSNEADGITAVLFIEPDTYMEWVTLALNIKISNSHENA